ncbi:MAG: LacI family DNA-binding transcriptional regulator, partial [Verrucomicrobiota bacterium]
MQRTTIKDIAKECGVSLSTVSLVLNNNPRISEKTRARVQSAVKKHGYQPNIHARGLASQTSQALSVVVPHLNHVFADIYFGEIVSGIYDRACEQNYKVLLDVANEKFVRSHEYLNLLKSRRADGMLFIASSIHDDYLREFENEPYTFLLVNHYFPGSSLNYLAVDYRDSARQAAEHLIGLGHRAIGIIAGTNTYTGLEFRDAFIEHARGRGLAEKDLPWADGGKEWSQEGGLEAARRLRAMNPKITAIMA